MKKKAYELLNKKHLLVIGKTETERRKFINELISKSNFETFRFPSKMNSFEQYLDFVKTQNLYRPWYDAKSYNGNQILDFHWDWISENHSLVVMEEIDLFENSWKIELLKTYLNELENRKKGEKKIHLIISQENENGLLNELSEALLIRENEKRTKRQIVEQNLELIRIE